MKVLYTWLCIGITVCAATAGDVLVALAMRRIGDLGELRRRRGFVPMLLRVLKSGVLFAGIFFMAIAFFSNLVGLSWADLSLMGPASAALTYISNALAAKLLLKEDVNRRRWLATIFVFCGVLILSHT
ncbi:MAG: EamA family transporter [Terriglobales bacterium]|jgi:drug/metabolite transporter (DMT)-like permease